MSWTKSRSELRREIETLRARVAEFEHDAVGSSKQSARRLELALRGTSDGVWYWEAGLEGAWWSPHLRELLGYGADELPASREALASLVHPEDRERTQEALREHACDKKLNEVEHRLRTRHAGYRWFLSREVAEWDEAGEPTRIAGSIRDLTERRQVESALRREKELSDSLIGSSLDGILAFDRELRYTIWNPVMEQISGVDHSRVVGRCAFDVFPFLRETGEEQHMREALAGRARVTRDRTYIIPETGRQGFFEGYYSPLRNESGEIIGGLGIIRDISERKQAEAQRAHLEEQLRESEKMRAIGQLAGGIAHDFNNLLTVVLGNTEMLLSRVRQDMSPTSADGVRLGLEQIRDAGERAAMLTRQLLTFGRMQVVKPEVLDLQRLIDGIDRLLRSLIREDIDLSVTVEPGTHCIRADASQIEQVIMNLVVNARDAMPMGGKLAITVANAPAQEGLGAPAGSEVMLSVRDTGVGIDKEHVSHVFEPFFTTKERGKGTGLGLATVYGIVTQAGGRTSVESRPGQGSTFRTYFPAVGERASAPADFVSSGRSRGNEVILVCEDDPGVRRILCETLRSAGYIVLDSERGKQALDVATCFDGTIDLLISDVIMPGMNGRELADKMVQRYPTTRVLLTSGYTDDVLGDCFSQRDERNFIQKPFSPDALLKSVRDLLDPA